MHLQSDPADGNALLEEVADQAMDVVGLAAETLRPVVVVDEKRLGIGRVRETEGFRDVAGAQLPQIDGVAQPAPVVGHGFVHHVPGHDAPAIAAHRRGDVVSQRLARVVRREPVEPGR